MGEYNFTEKGFDEFLYWQRNDKKMAKRIYNLLKSIDREGPMQGIGKPEPLKGRPGYSRRIDEKNRLIYDVEDGRITIESCLGHYDD